MVKVRVYWAGEYNVWLTGCTVIDIALIMAAEIVTVLVKLAYIIY